MGFFPFYTDIQGKACLIVGGGTVAARKAEKLLPFQPSITVVAPEICQAIREMDGVQTVKRVFRDEDLTGTFMVIGATDDTALNARISQLCRERRIPVNIVDQPALCSFYVPAIVRKEHITISISTEGESPLFARYLREKLEQELDADTLHIAALLSDCRKRIRTSSTEAGRKQILETLLRHCLDGDVPEELHTFLKTYGRTP